MNRIFLILCVLFAFLTAANAEEFYICIDQNGNSVLTNSPQDGMKKCVLRESYKDPTPEERAQEQSESKIKEQRKSQYNREAEAGRRDLERSRIQSKIIDKEKELQDILSRYSSARDLKDQER